MKKIFIILISSIFILTGCLNPIAVSVVEDMYTHALMEEDEIVATYFSEAFLSENPVGPLTDELAEQAQNVGGIKLLNSIELRKNQLQPDIVTELGETYSEEWFYIVVQPDEDYIMTWIVLKKETHYEIVDGEKMTVEAYNENVLN